MTSERLKWEGDSQKEIKSWPEDVRQDIGAELRRLQNHETPLMSKPMGSSLRGGYQISDEDKDFWYRLLYAFHAGWIYVLHCFKKKTNQTAKRDLEIAKQRLVQAKLRDDAMSKGEEKSA